MSRLSVALSGTNTRGLPLKLLLSAFLCAASAIPAFAQVAEVRAGIGAHDIRAISDLLVKEESIVINGEIIFEEPKFLKWAFSPQPYIGGQLNLGGGTSWGGAGLLWRQNLGKRFYADFGFGAVIHDGTLDVFDGFKLPDRDLTQEDFDTAFDELFFRRRSKIEYGSRVLLKEQLTLGYRLDEDWAIEGYFEHVSHGNFWTDNENDGSDSAGFRVNRKF